jgi:hypothetical protein
MSLAIRECTSAWEFQFTPTQTAITEKIHESIRQCVEKLEGPYIANKSRVTLESSC